MAVPRPTEVATVKVFGRSITNWESVMVQLRWGEAYDIFEFTTAESLPPAAAWLQIMPNIGDMVTINLGGFDVILGPVTIRQSAMDARQHTVQIIGKSFSFQVSKSTITSPDHNYDGKNILQIAKDVCGQVGVNAIGYYLNAENLKPFDRMSAQAGTPSWEFLEHL